MTMCAKVPASYLKMGRTAVDRNLLGEAQVFLFSRREVKSCIGWNMYFEFAYLNEK